MLPFTAEAFFALFEDYNAAIWPAQVVAYGLGALALWLSFRPRPGSNRTITAVLMAFWLWTGLVYHIMYFAQLNVAAPAFGAFFVLQGLLLSRTGVLRQRLAFRFQPDVFGWVGLGFVAFAMVLYPLVGWLAGHGWPEAAMFGVTPSPVTIFTLGMLLLTEGRLPLHLLVIPVLWSLIGGSAAWFLDVPEDLALPLAAFAGTGLAVWKNRRAALAP